MFWLRDKFLFLCCKSSDISSPLGYGVCGYRLFETLRCGAEITGPYRYFMEQTRNNGDGWALTSEEQLRILY